MDPRQPASAGCQVSSPGHLTGARPCPDEGMDAGTARRNTEVSPRRSEAPFAPEGGDEGLVVAAATPPVALRPPSGTRLATGRVADLDGTSQADARAKRRSSSLVGRHLHSVPAPASETAEGDEPDEADDDPEPETPEDRDDDPDDHKESAEGDASHARCDTRSQLG